MKFRSKIKTWLGILSISFIIGVYLLHILNVRFWNVGRGVITWDTISYYAYLPATFIYHDLSFEFIKEDPEYFNNKIWLEKTEEGNKIVKTSMGLAILYSPFFFIADTVAKNSEFEETGYSLPYHASLAFSGMFYLIFGFFFLWKILRRYFTEIPSALTLLVIGLATNIFSYATLHGTMPHAFNFTLTAMFAWYTIRWYEKQSVGYTLVLGLLAGLITLIRPTNFVVLLIFPLFGINNLKAANSRITFLIRKWYHLLVILFMILLVWTPQMIYWKEYTGHFLYFSYGSDERFFWTQPMIWKGLFGFRKGWFIYTPVMIFAVFGLFKMLNAKGDWKIPVITITILSLYIMLSWWCWWYGGGISLRPIIDYYPLLAIPLAGFISYLLTSNKIKKIILSGILSLTILLGIYHSVQYYYGAIHWDSMTWEAYKHSFGKVKGSQELPKYLEKPDYEKTKLSRNE